MQDDDVVQALPSNGSNQAFNVGVLPRRLWSGEDLTMRASAKLGVGKVWYKLPIWLQKNVGAWTIEGGAGYEVVPQTGYRNFFYTGWLVKKKLNDRLELGAEVFAHGREGFAAAQTEASAMIDLGGYYHFKHHE